MVVELSRYWWVLALRGIAAVAFGLLARFWPGLTLTVLVLFFGAYALVDGVLALVSAATGHVHRPRWALVVEGIVGVAAGIVTFVWPDISALALLFVIAAWSIVTGVLEVIAAVRLRQEIDNEWLLGLSGLASVAFGLIIAIFPGAGALAVVWLIGIYAVIFGVLMIALAFRLRDLQESPSERALRETVDQLTPAGAESSR